MDNNSIYRKIPRVDALLREKTAEEMIREYGYPSVLGAVREAVEQEREMCRKCVQREARVVHDGGCREADVEHEAQLQKQRIFDHVRHILQKQFAPEIRPVLNGTGVILHTGLGRAPLGEDALQAGLNAAGGSTSLEYDLDTGKRGERCSHFERILCRITGAEAAMAVNNNAAAVLLALTALARGGEVVVSRGELVEIGGEFRIPDVMEQSGAVLREAGTTNRTREKDYEQALCGETKAVMKVHTSNYRIVGFTESVPPENLSELCREHGIPLIADLGSGVLVSLEKYGLAGEPTVEEMIRKGADVVCFSGDKLLGGPQAGVIAGKAEYIEKMRRHPLARALRIDKFTAAVLERVMLEYLDPDRAVQRIPVLRMLTRTPEEIRKEAEEAVEMLRQAAGECVRAKGRVEITVEECCSTAGGGSLPGTEIRSFAVELSSAEAPSGKISASGMERRLRKLDTPVIGRIVDEKVLLDMRTFGKSGAEYLADVFRQGTLFREEDHETVHGA